MAHVPFSVLIAVREAVHGSLNWKCLIVVNSVVNLQELNNGKLLVAQLRDEYSVLYVEYMVYRLSAL